MGEVVVLADHNNQGDLLLQYMLHHQLKGAHKGVGWWFFLLSLSLQLARLWPSPASHRPSRTMPAFRNAWFA
jgi:hypothetical protein